jgi:hypothetical protein
MNMNQLSKNLFALIAGFVTFVENLAVVIAVNQYHNNTREKE